jgi:putative Mg2+ transporter-C (MgtC) family protein
MMMELEGVIRLTMATILGGIIGINRELRQKPAGLRTHALVALGAAAIMVVTDEIVPPEDMGAASRSIQGIITGIGFLGGGVILRPGDRSVRGLTTAATIWMAAALGTASGAGEWLLAMVVTGFAVAILVGGEVVEGWVHRIGDRWHGRPPEEPSGGLPDVSELGDQNADEESSR